MSLDLFVKVAVDVPGLAPLSYKVPNGEEPVVGMRCVVPVGRREMVGMIVEVSQHCEYDPSKVKPYRQLLSEVSPVNDEWLAMTRFAAEYYQHGWGEVAMANLPSFFRAKPRPQYLKSLERLRESKRVKVSVKPDTPPVLNDEQQEAVKAVVDHKGFGPFVLHGVTGSGKTEVYLHIMAEVLSRNPNAQILFLVPEINLTPQLQGRILRRFADRVVVSLHSGLSAGERARSWLAMHECRAQILVGTRMAVFANIPHLDLIIVDEEHDLSYKAGDGIRYSARDLAVKRAHLAKIPIVLGSATPSIESWAKVQSGTYRVLTLRERAIKTAVMPTLELVDPRVDKTHKGLCSRVIKAVEQALSRKEQVIVFLNRRGYAPVLTCPSCGWLSTCPHCSTYSVYHKSNGRLICHHCGWSAPVMHHCPDCGNADLAPVGAGTQRLEETLSQLWPEARILRIDRDTTQRKDSAQKAFDAVHAGEVDILVGTQMVAKGHDFQRVSTVIVLNVDSQLASANPRSQERAFANLMQVAGRAGRAGLSAKILVQTRFGDRPIFDALARQSYEMFADALLKERRNEGAVPFVSQALLMADAPHINQSLEFLQHAAHLGERIAETMPEREIMVFDPIPMALMRVADKERAQLLIEAPSKASLNVFLRQWYRALLEVKTNVHWVVEVDPMDV